jgi:hypothetical protein
MLISVDNFFVGKSGGKWKLLVTFTIEFYPN